MTVEERKEIKELLDNHLVSLMAQHNVKYQIIDFKLDAIKEQTTKTNGRVSKLEEREQIHVMNCPMISRVRNLEDNQLTEKAIKKWVIRTISLMAIGITIILGIAKLLFPTIF